MPICYSEFSKSKSYLGSGIEQLSWLLMDGRVQGFSAFSQRAVHQHLAIQVEAVEGIQAHLHFDVCHLHILARPSAQHLSQHMPNACCFDHLAEKTKKCQWLAQE